jgi:plastocyanin
MRWWSGVALLGVLLLAGCGATSSGGGGSSAPTTATATTAPATTMGQVKITEQNGKYGFDPAMTTVAKGTTVTWMNASDAPHTVTSDAGSTLASSTLAPSGGTFSFTFMQPGTYTYHCTIHPYMKGTIVVTG